jgi:hypothetical protein
MSEKCRSPLHWRSIAAGQYERQIDELELFYASLAATWAGTGHTYFAITSHVSFTVPIDAASSSSNSQISKRVEIALRKGWKKTRFEYPTLSAPVVYEPGTKQCKKVYQVPQDDGAEWINETFKVIDEGITGAQFINTDPDFGRFATMWLVIPPEHDARHEEGTIRRDVVFRCTHDLMDGVGTLMFLGKLMEFAAEAFRLGDAYPEVLFGDEWRNLSPCFRIAASLPIAPAARQQEKGAKVLAANFVAQGSKKLLTLPLNLKTSTPARSQRISFHFTPVETSLILQKCKKRGITATHAVHASIVLAILVLQPRCPEPMDVIYDSYSLLNLRHACNVQYNTAKHAATVYSGVSLGRLVVDLVIPSSKDDKLITSTTEFNTVLGEMKKYYAAIVIDDDFISLVPSRYAVITPPYPETQKPEVPPVNLVPTVSLSSLGLIDKFIDARHGIGGEVSEAYWEVYDPWVSGAEYSSGFGLFLSTFRGNMELSVAFNEAFHAEETEGEVGAFLQSAKDILLRGLGIND